MIRMPMDPPRLDVRQEKRIFLRCMSEPMNLVRTGVKRSKREAYQSTTPSFKVKNKRSLNVPTKRQSYFHVWLPKGHGNHYIVCYTL